MRIHTLSVIAVLCAALTGCADLGLCVPSCHSESHNSSSLVEFLYPRGSQPPQRDQVPELRVPLRIGLAFLPPSTSGRAPSLEASQRQLLLERIRQHFSSRKFVAEITVIPDYYLNRALGFEGLQGVQRLYSVDLMALVSYDQVTNEDTNEWSIAYWTIAGAYVIKGNRHDVATLVDLAVIDPASRALVLRAGGTSTGHGNSTLIAEQRELRALSDAGFTEATDQMLAHFDVALTKFESDVQAGTANVRVVRRTGAGQTGGGGGAGAFAWLDLLLLAPLCGMRIRYRR
jgi:rhombotail lipoprotein